MDTKAYICVNEGEKTNFDRYLERKLQDPTLRARFEVADQAWDIALQHRDQGLFADVSDDDLDSALMHWPGQPSTPTI